MAKEEKIEVEGKVVEILKENGAIVDYVDMKFISEL